MQLGKNGRLEALCTYPIKGLSPVSHDTITLRAGEGFPGDRLFGFAKGNSGFDPANPKPLPKNRFLVLMQHAKLAGLQTSLDPETLTFTVAQAGRTLLNADLGSEEGKSAAAGFFALYLQLKEEENPFFASSAPHRFTDVSVDSETMMNAVSLINLASVRDFGTRIGETVDPRRFRANILFDGWPPFAEFDLIGRTIRLGEVSLKILTRTKRCAATEVNPGTAERDMKVPALLRRTYDHLHMGVYAEVISDGEMTLGDLVSLQDA